MHAFLELIPGRFGCQNLDLDKLRDASFWRDFHGFGVKQSRRTADLLGELQGTPSTQNVDVAALLQEVTSQQQSAFVGKGLELSAETTSEGLSGLNTDEPRPRQRLQPRHPSRRMNRPRR